MTTTSEAPVTSTPPTTAVATSTSSSTATTTATPMYYVANDLAGVKPPSFNWDSSNLAQTFKAFKRYCEIVLATPMYANRTNKKVVNYILLWMGPKGVEIFDNWKITEEEKTIQPQCGRHSPTTLSPNQITASLVFSSETCVKIPMKKLIHS